MQRQHGAGRIGCHGQSLRESTRIIHVDPLRNHVDHMTDFSRSASPQWLSTPMLCQQDALSRLFRTHGLTQDKDQAPSPAPPAVTTADAHAEATLETSRARELYEAGRLPLTSAEAAMDARRRLFGWIKGLFAR
jgi:hypothetical protein